MPTVAVVSSCRVGSSVVSWEQRQGKQAEGRHTIQATHLSQPRNSPIEAEGRRRLCGRGDPHHGSVHGDGQAGGQLAGDHERVALEPLERRLVRVADLHPDGVLPLGQLGGLRPAVVHGKQLAASGWSRDGVEIGRKLDSAGVQEQASSS